MAPCEWVIDIIKQWVIDQAYATMAWVLGKNYQSGADMPEWTMPLTVAGEITPDSTCTYLKSGIYNERRYYRRTDGTYFIWWNGIDTWHITPVLGTPSPHQWTRIDPDILGDYAPGAGSSGTATVTEGYNYLKTSFVDRGDPAAEDWDVGDFTNDSAWHDLDLSGIVPAGAKAVLFTCTMRSLTISKEFRLRKKGNANSINISKIIAQVSGVNISADLVCPCDSDRFVQYWSELPAFSSIFLTVKGWWL